MLLNEVDEADLLIETNEDGEDKLEKKSNNAVKLLAVDEFEEW